ncbi:hypothetical protein BGZ74_003863, partial [Mortierella antarctica]
MDQQDGRYSEADGGEAPDAIEVGASTTNSKPSDGSANVSENKKGNTNSSTKPTKGKAKTSSKSNAKAAKASKASTGAKGGNGAKGPMFQFVRMTVPVPNISRTMLTATTAPSTEHPTMSSADASALALALSDDDQEDDG